MTKNDQPTKPVPRLRFPEFREAGEWEPVQICKLASFKSGGTPSKGNADYWGGPIPWVSAKDMKTLRLEDSKDHLSQLAVEHGAKLASAGTLLMLTRGMTLMKDVPICLLQRPMAFNQDVKALSPRKGVLSEFLAYLLIANKPRLRALVDIAGHGTGRLNTDEVKGLELSKPELAEQRKLAGCLGSLDDWIAAETDALAELRRHKTGLMQQLFPCPGEARPRLRFPEFRDAGGWKKRKAGTLFRQRKEKGTPGLPIYSVTIDSGLVKRSSFDRNFYDIEDATGHKKVRRGDIAYNMMRMWQGACGCAHEDCLVSPAYVVLEPGSDSYAPFFQSFFKLRGTIQILTAYSRGLTLDRLRLYFEDFAAMPLVVPSRDEQRRIADCLLSLDTLIASHESRLAILFRHKRGLMQQLFPPVGGRAGAAS